MNNKTILVVVVVIIATLLITALGFFVFSRTSLDPNNKVLIGKLKDDWVYKPEKSDSGFWGGITKSITNGFNSRDVKMMSMSVSFPESAMMSASPSIGFSVGGAKDINNFRENIENGYFPRVSDITYNGLFYDYYFETGMKNESTDLFSPSYSMAVSKDPVSEKEEYYMTVGLNSNIKESDFQRKKLNLTIVMDISGSMSSRFNSYYYDDPFGMKGENENNEDDEKTKMTIANEAVVMLMDKLTPEDRLGIVLFDDAAYKAKKMNLVGKTDMKAIKKHVLEITPQGGTNFEAGYIEGTKFYDELKNVDSNEYENRIIFITDAMPNRGRTGTDDLFELISKNADDGIYTTVIGVGVDFNTELIEEITKTKGANYYSVHSSKEFKERMGEQFEYMVTPLVFDLELNFQSDDYEIASVYGSDAVNKENGNIMKVNTLFPSKSSGGEVKGGVVLLKLNKKTDDPDGNITLTASYKDRNGETHESNQEVTFTDNGQEFYDNTGIRKAIVLTRFANVLKNWVAYERSEENRFVIVPTIGIGDCILDEELMIELGEHEHPSVELTVSDEYKEIFTNFSKYLEEEIKSIGDESMKQEIELLEELT